MKKADNSEHTCEKSCPSQPDISTENHDIINKECTKELDAASVKDNAEDNSASRANHEQDISSHCTNNLENVDEAPTNTIKAEENSASRANHEDISLPCTNNLENVDEAPTTTIKAEENSASRANQEDISLPCTNNLEDLDEEPTSIKPADTCPTVSSLVDAIITMETINSDTGHVDNSTDIEIEPYAVAYETSMLDKTSSNELDEHEPQDTHNRDLLNPMYGADIAQTINNTSEGHELQDPSYMNVDLVNHSNSPQPATGDTQGETVGLKTQTHPIKELLPNVMYNVGNDKDATGGKSSSYHLNIWLVAFAVFLVLVAMLATGLLVGVYHNTQDEGDPMVTPMHVQGSGNFSTFIMITEPTTTNGTNPPILDTTSGLGLQQTEVDTSITIGGFGKTGKKQKNYGKFNMVGGLAVSSTNDILVSDTGNRRVQVFSMKGVFLRSFSTTMKPKQISIDHNHDTLWVVMESKYTTKTKNPFNINHYSREGYILAKYRCGLELQMVTGTALDTLSNSIIITTKRRKWKNGIVGRFGKDSCRMQRFAKRETIFLKWPHSIAVDKKGNIFITDKESHLVFKHDKDGKYLSCFGRIRKGDGVLGNHLLSPRGICVDSLGRIIVADYGNSRVVMFTADGDYIRTIVKIRRPEHVATSREGQLVVSSEGFHAVTIFPKY
uniref:SMP-30/Gluconolactonase/LRE-like region domain-containing protein n=1 Tax=Branchiostoma floridae TaxID=7739 RepID=C3YED6_BRAFL|eukprot:XP_002605434.1 hypothetical protein BRAFLDRAFT_74249 [Branchiostoma floridae]